MSTRVAFVSWAIAPDKITGPRQSITSLASGLARTGTATRVFSPRTQHSFEFNETEIVPASQIKVADHDMLVAEGIYLPSVVATALRFLLAGKSVVISPRSNLMRTAMSAKKRIYLALAAPVIRRSVLHFLSDAERAHSLYADRPSIVVPNGVADALFDYPIAARSLASPPVFGFLGRLAIHHKGLDLLFDAAARLKDRGRDFRIILCGPPHKGSIDDLRARISRLRLDQIVEIRDPVDGNAEKLRFFEGIDFFIHPSRYEGLPQAAMEAMVRGLPVVVSDQTNLGPFLGDAPLPLIHQTEVEAIAKSYDALLGLSQQEHTRLAGYCRRVAEASFRWDVVSRTFAENIEAHLRSGAA